MKIKKISTKMKKVSRTMGDIKSVKNGTLHKRLAKRKYGRNSLIALLFRL